MSHCFVRVFSFHFPSRLHSSKHRLIFLLSLLISLFIFPSPPLPPSSRPDILIHTLSVKLLLTYCNAAPFTVQCDVEVEAKQKRNLNPAIPSNINLPPDPPPPVFVRHKREREFQKTNGTRRASSRRVEARSDGRAKQVGFRNF